MTMKNTALLVVVLVILSGCELPMIGCAGCPNRAIWDGQVKETDPFLVASGRGDLAVVRAMLASGQRVDTRGPRGETALLRASRGGHGEIVELLLNEGADANAASGEYEGVWRTVNGQQVYQRDFHLFSTPLMEAAGEGRVSLMRTLIEHGAEADAVSYNGMTALDLATRSGSHDAMRLLLAAKADVNDRSLASAAGNGDYEAVGLLLAAGANAKRGGYSAILVAAGDACWIPRRHPDKAQPESFQKTVELLLEAGARTEGKDSDGNTALIRAVRCPSRGIAPILLRAGVAVDTRGYRGLTALSHAARNGDQTMVALLLANGADPNIVDAAGSTPLLYAARGRHSAVVDVLVKASANVNVADQNGKTPLMIAIEEDDLGAVDILTAHGADMNAKTELGLTAMHFARLATGNNAGAIRKSLERAGMRE